MADHTLTAARLREVLHYEPETGVFTRKIRLAQRHQVGDRADLLVTGGGLCGYRRVALDSKRHLAHRLAWLYIHGNLPADMIDHINGQRDDNRISNLREADARINLENQRRPHSHSQSGFLGVYFEKQAQRYRARVVVGGKTIELGLHRTAEAAHQAYLAGKRKHHDGCTI